MKFEEPKFTVIEFSFNDVIATSGESESPQSKGPVIEANEATYETMLG